MEGVLIEITNPNVVFERLTDQSIWRKLKLPEKIAVEKIAKVKLKPAKKEYKKYTDRQREDLIDRTIESALATWFVRELGIKPHVAQRWWKMYREAEEEPYKRFSISSGPQSSCIDDHHEFLRNLK